MCFELNVAWDVSLYLMLRAICILLYCCNGDWCHWILDILNKRFQPRDMVESKELHTMHPSNIMYIYTKGVKEKIPNKGIWQRSWETMKNHIVRTIYFILFLLFDHTFLEIKRHKWKTNYHNISIKNQILAQNTESSRHFKFYFVLYMLPETWVHKFEYILYVICCCRHHYSGDHYASPTLLHRKREYLNTL